MRKRGKTQQHLTTRRAFSLVELVITIVIIAIIAGIAIPRLSAASNCGSDVTLVADLSVFRKAIQLYYAEHESAYPTDDKSLAEQMTLYTDADGNTSPTKTSTHVYGPYLASIPALPVGKYKGLTKIKDGSNPGSKKGGWWYFKKTGEIRANLKNDQVDSSGTPYNSY